MFERIVLATAAGAAAVVAVLWVRDRMQVPLSAQMEAEEPTLVERQPSARPPEVSSDFPNPLQALAEHKQKICISFMIGCTTGGLKSASIEPELINDLCPRDLWETRIHPHTTLSNFSKLLSDDVAQVVLLRSDCDLIAT